MIGLREGYRELYIEQTDYIISLPLRARLIIQPVSRL
jgi:hypothetical protein